MPLCVHVTVCVCVCEREIRDQVKVVKTQAGYYAIKRKPFQSQSSEFVPGNINHWSVVISVDSLM